MSNASYSLETLSTTILRKNLAIRAEYEHTTIQTLWTYYDHVTNTLRSKLANFLRNDHDYKVNCTVLSGFCPNTVATKLKYWMHALGPNPFYVPPINSDGPQPFILFKSIRHNNAKAAPTAFSLQDRVVRDVVAVGLLRSVPQVVSAIIC